VLVTGGTGSFGNFIVHRLLKEGVKEIRILSRDEKKQYDMRLHYGNNTKLKFFLGDIRDYSRVKEVTKGVNIVFQAAALKHVPFCEQNPFEGVQTNILGVQNVIKSALEEKVEKFITISTDKAVKPVNVMGMTKAVQERLTIAANLSPLNSGTVFSCVRYGNVMSSRGSVIPFFKDKLSRNEDLLLTDVGMTRFMLTLSDAIDLVLYAIDNSKGGEIFVKKSPSAKILDVARILSEDMGINFNFKLIGKFPGEKIHEILITEEELIRTKNMGEYFIVHPSWTNVNLDDLNEEYISSKELLEDDKKIRELFRRSDDEIDIVSFEGKEFSKLWAKQS
jgi:UDP-N-acetylglucosamine 4,6-dehydratase/5-epimerase